MMRALVLLLCALLTVPAAGSGIGGRGSGLSGLPRDLTVESLNVQADTGSTAQVKLWDNVAGAEYQLRYYGSGNYFSLWSTDIDGAGTDGDVFTVADGGRTAVFNGPVGVNGSVPAYAFEVVGSSAFASTGTTRFVVGPNGSGAGVQITAELRQSSESAVKAFDVVDRTGASAFYVTVGGNVASDRPCASGYTRLGTNYCVKDVFNPSSMTRDTCVDVAPPVSDSKAIVVWGAAWAGASGSSGQRSAMIQAFKDSGCVTLYSQGSGYLASSYAYEPSGVTSGTIIGKDSGALIIPSSATGGNVSLFPTDGAGNKGQWKYAIIGYID